MHVLHLAFSKALSNKETNSFVLSASRLPKNALENVGVSDVFGTPSVGYQSWDLSREYHSSHRPPSQTLQCLRDSEITPPSKRTRTGSSLPMVLQQYVCRGNGTLHLPLWPISWSETATFAPKLGQTTHSCLWEFCLWHGWAASYPCETGKVVEIQYS